EVDGKSINIGSPYDARVQISYRKEELAPDCIKALFNHERLNHIVGDYTGGLTKPQDVMMEKISPPLMFRDNDWWHIDNLADHFKAQLILNDMDINDGPFKFIKGTHKNFSAKQKARYHKMYALQGIKTQESNHFEDEFTTPELCTEFVANAGDIALFDPKLHHSWRYPYDNGERNNIFIYYIKIPTLKNKILGRIDQYLNFK
ncbi:MAG: hypothetical protein HON94_13030, partial [Methylococcales bacterium]|nr:hypothetical protein [Methylococcales bacterium]